MKNSTVIVLVMILNALVYAGPMKHYTDEYDNINVDEILNNERIFNNYFNCIKTGIKCTPAGAKLREILPDALQTKCEKCTEAQREKAKIVINYVAKNKPEKFLELEELFDKERNYRKMYATEMKQEGIVLPD